MTNLAHKFVTSVPEILEDGVLYISIEYATAIHKCCCGCGSQVVTPFSPKGWKLIFDGETITLRPSIGNWSFKCQSHYFITNSRVEWIPRWMDLKDEDSPKPGHVDSDLSKTTSARKSLLERFRKGKGK